MIPFSLSIATSSDVKDSALLGLFPLPIDFNDFLFASRTRLVWLNSGSLLMLEKDMLVINIFFVLFGNYKYINLVNIQCICKHFFERS